MFGLFLSLRSLGRVYKAKRARACKKGIFAKLGSRGTLFVRVVLGEQALRIGCTGDSSKPPGKLLLGLASSLIGCGGAIGSLDFETWRIRGTRGNRVGIMVTQSWLALMGKIRVRMSRGTHSFIHLVALARHGVCAQSANCITKELGVTGFRIGSGSGRGLFLFLVLILIARSTASTTSSVHAEEIAQTVADLAGAIGVLLGGHSGDTFVEDGWIGGDGDRLIVSRLKIRFHIRRSKNGSGQKKGAAVMSRRAEELLRNEGAANGESQPCNEEVGCLSRY